MEFLSEPLNQSEDRPMKRGCSEMQCGLALGGAGDQKRQTS